VSIPPKPEVYFDPSLEYMADPYPSWHKIFWLANIGWSGIYAMLLMVIPCYLVSVFTKDTSGYIPDPDLHLSMFSSPIWPNSLKNYFMLEVHRKRNLEEKVTFDELLEDEKESFEESFLPGHVNHHVQN